MDRCGSGGSAPSKGLLTNDDLIERNAKHCRQYHQIVDRGESCTPLPLVDGLGRSEAEDILQIPYGQTCADPQSCDILSCRRHVDDRNVVH